MAVCIISNLFYILYWHVVEKLTVLWTIENLYYLPVVLYIIVILCDVNSFVVNFEKTLDN